MTNVESNIDTPEVKRRVGRPLKYEDHEKLKRDIAEYFAKTPQDEWLITGLAVHLGTSRNTLMEYEDKPEFVNTVKGAKDRIEMAYELDLRKKGTAGSIFGLKNFGWKDKFEVDQDNRSSDGSMSPKAGKSDVDAMMDIVKQSTADKADA